MNLALYFLGIFCLSQAANLVKLAAAPPDVIGFWRLMAAAILLLPWAVWRGGLGQVLKTRPRELFYILLTAAFFFGHLWTYFYAAQQTRIANAMIIFATNPLFASAGSFLLFRERFTWKLALAYALALGGIIQLVQHSLSWDPTHVSGDVSALISAILFSGYLLSTKKARRSFSNATFSCLLYFFTSLFFGFSGLAKSLNFTDYPAITWWSIAGTVLLPTLLGHAVMSYLMNSMNLNLMTCGKLIEPVLSAVAAYFIFSEIPSPRTALAFALTATAVFILFFPFEILRKRKP